ncbi:transketolase [Candidatus Woesearchaeota archaeon]|nr:transketolase [Candidatus Woesearchaeota archaeon]
MVSDVFRAKQVFPIDVSGYKRLRLSLLQKELTSVQRVQLTKNVAIVRDCIVFMTAYAHAKGVGGHTGGAYDIVPEALILDGFMQGEKKIVPILYDEAGHRVALQYVLAALHGHIPISSLLFYRDYKKGLYGHPERDEKQGIMFSSGRLGHLWSFVNGVAQREKGKKVVVLGSDGSQQEGNDAEAARYAVAHKLDVLVVVDDNNVTIEGHPREYMPGYSVAKTLEGHGLRVHATTKDDLNSLFSLLRKALSSQGPQAVVVQSVMARGIEGIEGLTIAHDAVPVDVGVRYLAKRGHVDAAEMLKSVRVPKLDSVLVGSGDPVVKNRSEFGKVVVDILDHMSPASRTKNLVVSCDLGGSTGIDAIEKKYPALYQKGGVMERNNFSVAAGFGAVQGCQGIVATFSVFSEMLNSEIAMARLNNANVLAHFSHAGVDEMADNTCHFGMNVFFTDNGFVDGDTTRLYYPADSMQLRLMLQKVFFDAGLRFVFTPRSATPTIFDTTGKPFFGRGYKFVSGKDDLVRTGKDGYVIAYGEMLYRCLDAVERLKKEKGINLGVVNKSTLNVIDEVMMKKLVGSSFVAVVEAQNEKTGLGIRFGTWLLERGFKGRYVHKGTTKKGLGGEKEQIGHQGLESEQLQMWLRKELNK